MASITELAKELNLSKGTVSRILNDQTAPYAAKTRHRVLEHAAKMGYQPNAVARALATGRTDTVALWVSDLRGFYHSWVVRALSRQFDAAGYHLLIRLFGQAPASDGTARPLVLSDTVDGVITHGLPPNDWAARFQNTARTTPFVVTGGVDAGDFSDLVGVNISPAAVAAVEHLLETGRRRIALLTLPNPFDSRYGAYVDCMAAAGRRAEIIPLTEGSRAETRRLFREYVAAHGHPDAVFCHNDDTAIAVYRALCDLGLRVPDDVALVGCDGIEDTEFLPVPITTIVQPIEEMARLAWQFLRSRMRDPTVPPQRIVLEAHLEIRESSRR